MTVFAKDITYGLETTIKHLQEHIDSKLTWSGNNNIYGLIHRNSSEDGIIPEAYIGSGSNNKEYKQVFVNDKLTSSLGFLESGDRDLVNGRNVDIDVIVTMRLDLAFPDDLRNNELAMLQFERILKSFYAINTVESSKQGIENVFSEFYYDNIIYRDMHPWLVFSMRVNLFYNDNITNCSISVH